MKAAVSSQCGDGGGGGHIDTNLDSTVARRPAALPRGGLTV